MLGPTGCPPAAMAAAASSDRLLSGLEIVAVARLLGGWTTMALLSLSSMTIVLLSMSSTKTLPGGSASGARASERDGTGENQHHSNTSFEVHHGGPLLRACRTFGSHASLLAAACSQHTIASASVIRNLRRPDGNLQGAT
jgi:hypothetical protein